MTVGTAAACDDGDGKRSNQAIDPSVHFLRTCFKLSRRLEAAARQRVDRANARKANRCRSRTDLSAQTRGVVIPDGIFIAPASVECEHRLEWSSVRVQLGEAPRRAQSEEGQHRDVGRLQPHASVLGVLDVIEMRSGVERDRYGHAAVRSLEDPGDQQ